MKQLKQLAVAFSAIFLTTGAYAQLQDEKNVTITMDLQPILQLNMETADQIDFTFNNISSYYSGITKYGATILKVSATVSFDLWAQGLSNGQLDDKLWDQQVIYGGGGTGSTNLLPLTALELRQFPANPSIAATCVATAANFSDYSAPFQVRNQDNTILSNNRVFVAATNLPYTAPTSTADNASEKFIAGGTGTTDGCQVVGGSYLTNAGAALTSDYRYVIDYRIVPGLPVVFPAHLTDAAGGLEVGAVAAEAQTDLEADGTVYAQPGVYTMYVKYILAEDL
jgi:hypothetical protein